MTEAQNLEKEIAGLKLHLAQHLQLIYRLTELVDVLAENNNTLMQEVEMLKWRDIKLR